MAIPLGAYVSVLEESNVDSEATDKAWYIPFNCFENSRGVAGADDLPPTDLALLLLLFRGAQQLHRADSFIINLIPKTKAPDIAAALTRVQPGPLRNRYLTVQRGWFHPGDYLANNEQFAYCWLWHERITVFFQRHQHGERHILFSSQYQ